MSPEESKKTVATVGPFGSLNQRGKPFDDGMHSATRGLVIYHYPGKTILYVQFEYDDDGISVWSGKHGVNKYMDTFLGIVGGQWPEGERKEIRFNYPDEFLTSVYGSYMNDWGGISTVISLTFNTNRRTYGPFGSPEHFNATGSFTIHVPGSKIVGFHGRSNRWGGGINTVGAYLKPHDDQQMQYPPSSKAQMLHPSKCLYPPGCPSQIKLKKDDRPQIQKHFTVQDTQVSGNNGNNNGAFYLGDRNMKAKYYITEAHIANVFKDESDATSKMNSHTDFSH